MEDQMHKKDFESKNATAFGTEYSHLLSPTIVSKDLLDNDTVV